MRYFLLLTALFCNGITSAQNNVSVKEDWDFVMYLIGNGFKDEAVTLVNNVQSDSDSIYFLKGFTFYSSKMLDLATDNFEKIKQASALFNESKFFSALSNSHLYRLDKAKFDLNQIVSQDDEIINLKTFEFAGISLLSRDKENFNKYINQVDSNDFAISEEIKQLKRIEKQIDSYRKKYKWVAGGLSAIVPGLGKLYAGNVGEGLAAFLTCGSLIGITAENYYKKGITNWKTILFGTLSTIFYVGNIYGSAVGVKVNCENFNQRMNVQILYNIHIPIRNRFRY